MSINKEKKNSFIGSASVVASSTAFSRVLGLVREQVMAYFFGASMATDAFVTAFRIPNLLRDMFAEGALSQAFIPIFKEKIVNSSDKEAFRIADIVFTALLLVVGLIVLLGIIAAPVLIFMFANGFVATPEKFDLTVNLTRIMMVYLLLVSLSAIVMGMLNSFGKFGIPALSPALFNLGIIVTVVGFHSFFPQPIYSLAIGVLVGGVGQLVIQLPLLLKIGYRFKPTIDFLDENFKKITRLLGPMIIGLSASRINILINTLVASFLIEGSISYLSYSYRLMHFPLGVFAVALGTVALPKVTELVAKGENEKLNEIFEKTLTLNMFVVIPSAMFLAFMGKEIIELIFAWGAFTEADVQNTSLALLHYSYGLIAFAAVRVIVPFFYAHSDSKLPMRASLTAVVINIALYYPLVKILNFAGLAAATSLAGVANCAVLLYYLSQKGINCHFGKLFLSIFRILTASFFAFYVTRFIPFRLYDGSYELFIRIESLFVPLISAIVLYLIFAFMLRVPIVTDLLRKLRRK